MSIIGTRNILLSNDVRSISFFIEKTLQLGTHTDNYGPVDWKSVW